jgi:hypothetical protein
MGWLGPYTVAAQDAGAAIATLTAFLRLNTRPKLSLPTIGLFKQSYKFNMLASRYKTWVM